MTVAMARELMNSARYEEARQLLAGLLDEPATDRLRAVAHGMLGECDFGLGDAASAIEPTTTALRMCEDQDDRAGIRAYLENLVEMHRYLGQAEPAANAAERVAEVLAREGEQRRAAWRRRQAGIIRAGEPLNRVVVMLDGGVRCEVGDVPAASGVSVTFVFERDRITLAPASARTAEGERLGSAGQFAEAYEAFQQAARLDPYDPHAHYLSGLSLLHLRRYDEAIAEYETTERLAPGWFHCRTDLWLARELAAGALTPEQYELFYLLEHAPLPPHQKVQTALAALRATPRLAPLYLFHGQAMAALGRSPEASYRDGLDCAAEPDIRGRLLVALSTAVKSDEERRSLRAEAAAMTDGNLVASAMASVALRAA
ncbi:tetratricopeptide repeat protein [Paractinoplanes atraurantiacus]|uniref:Tetratricopeptide repeat-containing protein n=1 Tax=Paractinoplanes atraurantiacus TaxID=1036182 RepID=A0A285ICY4_9ACTN|nr:tetratricopeptide repeat protein [Actinoplanes atraurantiacus]SNY45845.1 Tetratricopeptide repeat-containing protein [Actinoplanes atraurantiacus]